MTEVDIRLLGTSAEIHRLGAVFDQIWGTRTAVVNVEVMRAVAHAGGYVAGAFDGDQLVGGSLGFLARHRCQPALHSHVTGVVPGVRGTGLGRRIKLHQRSWAADHGLRWITWTFDPLVRRNAWFNLAVLGARVEEYLVDFYGPMADAVNGVDESDRLLVAWPVAPTEDDDRLPRAGPRGSEATTQSGTAGAPAPSPAASTEDTSTVPTPPDIVSLRRTDPADAAAWRRRVRAELGGALALGARVVAFTPGGDYVVARGGAS